MRENCMYGSVRGLYREVWVYSTNKKNKKITLTFAKKQMKGILSGMIHPESFDTLENGNTEYHYLRINKGKYEEHPSRDNNICVAYWVNENKVNKYDCFELIKFFIENIGKDKLGAWLEKM